MIETKDEVYFIQESLSKKIKIGYTSNLKYRFQSLCTSNPNKLFILGSIGGTEEDEKKIHHKFIKYKYRGEWFHPAQEILDFIHEKTNEEIAKNNEKFTLNNKESMLNNTESMLNNTEIQVLKEEIMYSVIKAVGEIGLSRARFYQLLSQGVFPKPLYDELSGRPYYTSIMLAEMKKTIRTSIGANGKICLFYNSRI